LAMLSLLLLPLRLTRSPMLAIPVWTSRAAHGSQNELAAVVGPATSKLTQITRSQAQPLKPSVLSTSKPGSHSSTGFGFSQLVFLCWLCGACLNLTWLAARHARLRMLRQTADPLIFPQSSCLLEEFKAELRIRQEVLLLRSDRCKVPMTWGFFNPVIMAPPE